MSAARSRNRLFLFLCLAAALPVGIFLFKGRGFGPRVCFSSRGQDVCVRVTLARTPSEHARGLMFRRVLPYGEGMLFIFPQDGIWTFWMKNTFIPLDIVWLDAGRRVVEIVTAQPASDKEGTPPVFAPRRPARYVLEANAGFTEEHHIRVADTARFEWIFDAKKI